MLTVATPPLLLASSTCVHACPTRSSQIPNVTRQEYSLLDIDEDFVSLMDEAGETREDLTMPKNDDDLAAKIRSDFDEGKSLIVTVQKAMNEEHIMSYKEENTK